MGIYALIESFNSKEIFVNATIILVFMFFFMKLSIGLNIILGLVLAVTCILYLTERKTNANKIEHEQMERKIESIKPEPTNFVHDKDLIDFTFSVQDFYVFNPQAYEEFVDNVNAFKSLYDNVFNDKKFANYYYQIATSKKNNALNAFHSIIFCLPNDKIFTEKFDRAHKRLETILNKYINELYDRCDHYLIEDGYDILKRPLNRGPGAFNDYFDKDFTYQFY
jgi:hypothetical protein